MSYKMLNNGGDKKNAYVWVEKLLEKLFYESNGKRHNEADVSKIKKLSQSSKDYLEYLYDLLDSKKAIYTTAFKDKFGKLPETTEEKIYTIASNHFGGFGRTALPQTKLSTLPLPPNDVINDMIGVFMDSQRKKELVNLGKKLGLID